MEYVQKDKPSPPTLSLTHSPSHLLSSHDGLCSAIAPLAVPTGLMNQFSLTGKYILILQFCCQIQSHKNNPHSSLKGYILFNRYL